MFETNWSTRDGRFPAQRQADLDDALLTTAWDLHPLLWIADQLQSKPIDVLRRAYELGLHDLPL